MLGYDRKAGKPERGRTLDLMDFEQDRPIGPEADERLRPRVLWVLLFAAYLATFLIALRYWPEGAWLPAAATVLHLLGLVSGRRRNTVASQAALDRLRECFQESGEPELPRVFAALKGAEELRPVSAAVLWSQRYQLGMISKAEYYAGMHQFLQKYGAAP